MKTIVPRFLFGATVALPVFASFASADISALPLVTQPLLTFRHGFDKYRVHQATSEWQGGSFLVRHEGSDPHACWIVPNNFAGQKPFPAPDSIIVRTSPSCRGYLVVAFRSQSTGKEFRFNGKWGADEVEISTAELGREDMWTLDSLTFGFAEPKQPHQFEIKEILCKQRMSLVNAVSFDVETGNSLRLLTNRTACAKMKFENFSDSRAGIQGSVHAVDYFGRSFSCPINLDLPPGGVVSQTIGPFKTKGLWRISADMTASDGSRAKKEARLLKTDSRGPTSRLARGKFRIGTVCHLERHDDAERKLCLDLATALGMKILRADLFAMERLQPNGPNEWNVDFDRKVLEDLEAYGIDLDAIIHRTPKWAAPEDTRDQPWIKRAFGQTQHGVFETYCERLAREFGTRIAYYEIGNEWDLAPKGILEVDDAARMQAEAYRGVKRGCPDAIVCSNGFAAEGDNQQVQKKGFHEAFLNKAKGTFDVHAIHIHGGFEPYAKAIKGDFFALRERTGTRVPWYSNETATLPCFGAEDSAARAVWQKVLFAWAHGSVDYCWYNLESGSWREGGSDWGLYTAGWQPRATAAAFASLTKVFSGLDFRRIHVCKGARHIYEFGKKGRTVLVGWDSGASLECEIPVATDARKAVYVDLMGNVTTAAFKDDAVAFKIGVTPSALVLIDATRLEFDKELMGTPSVPSLTAQIIPMRAASSRPPDFTVDTLISVQSLFSANPLTESRDWKGPDDLSARVWLGLSKNALQMLFEVRDDIHVQKERAARMYIGDSIQIAFRSYEQDGDWLIGLSGGSGASEPEVFVWTAPSGIGTAAASSATRLDVVREGNCTRYAFSMPYSTLGLSPESLRNNGLRFNFMVNDNDGEGRDGWIQLASGISSGRDATLYPFIKFQQTNTNEGEQK